MTGVDPARKNRRRTMEARQARKLAMARPTMGQSRFVWLSRVMRSKYDPAGEDAKHAVAVRPLPEQP